MFENFPQSATWSERVTLVLGLNPGPFVGPGTNTFLIGTGKQRFLLDTGHGVPEYIPLLEKTMREIGCEALQGIVLTHNHPDHNGGLIALRETFGAIPIFKKVIASDGVFNFEFSPLEDGALLETEGARLRAIFTPGHALDHLCFLLEEEAAIFTGDNVLGVGSSVIPAETGSMRDYMNSLERLKAENPKRLYPAHGPLIENAVAKLDEYLAHRRAREAQIVRALQADATHVSEIVTKVYADVDKVLHVAAAQSVAAHLIKLEQDGRAQRCPAQNAATPRDPLAAEWVLLDSVLERLQSASAALRMTACRQMTEMTATPEIVAALAQALLDTEKCVARTAVDALAKFAASDGTARAALQQLLRSPHLAQRWGAACALLQLEPPTPRMLPIFVSTLESVDGDLRWAAARHLVAAGRLHPEVQPLLLGLARDRDSAILRRMALYCLRELSPEDPKTAQAMLEASHDTDLRVQRAALTAMAALLDPEPALLKRLLTVAETDHDLGSRRIAPITLSEIARRNAPQHDGAAWEAVWARLRTLAATNEDPSLAKALQMALERAASGAKPASPRH